MFRRWGIIGLIARMCSRMCAAQGLDAMHYALPWSEWCLCDHCVDACVSFSATAPLALPMTEVGACE